MKRRTFFGFLCGLAASIPFLGKREDESVRFHNGLWNWNQSDFNTGGRVTLDELKRIRDKLDNLKFQPVMVDGKPHRAVVWSPDPEIINRINKLTAS